MNLRNLRLLLGKELLDLFRDRRTIFTMMVMPMLMMPLSMVSTNMVMSKSRKDAEQERFRIAYSAPPEAAPVVAAMRSAGFDMALSADPRAEAVAKKAAAGVAFSRRGEVIKATVYADQSEGIRWQVLRGRIRDIIDKLRDDQLTARLRGAGLPVEIANPYTMESVNLAQPRKMAGTFMGGFLSFMMIIFLMNGAMYGAVDMTAGEKERKTIEILLSSAAGRAEIVTAKVLTAATISLLTAGLSVLSLLLSFRMIVHNSQDKDVAAIFSLPTDAATIALIIVTIVPMALFAAALAVALATPARSSREGMSYLTPIFFVLMMLCGVSFIPAFENSPWLALVPVANFTQALRELLRGEWSWLAFGGAMAVNAAAAALAIVFAAGRFRNEKMLLRV